ncbi:MAG: response regulator [Desulfobacterales bacterium]|nr:response regulator [Desulfobacterales bacterium]
MNENILIVDDEQDILDALSAALSVEDFNVKTALGGEQGIEMFRSEPFDLVVTDIRMPHIDGLEVIRQVKQMDEDAEVIVLTGFPTIENAVGAMKNYGAFDFIQKPLDDIEQLAMVICKALDKRKLKLENRLLLSKLNQVNQELNRRVKERTADLVKLNEQLQLELTQRKRAEEQLIIAKENAEAASRAKTEFLSIMSHELRTPLNSIIGFNKIVSDKMAGDLNHEQEDLLKMALKSAQNLLALIDDILNLTQTISDNLEILRSAIRVKDFLRQLVSIFEEKAAKRGIVFLINIENVPEIIIADKQKIRQVLLHLLSNAVKFNTDNGKVHLDVKFFKGDQNSTGNSIEFSVADTGIGIRQEDMERIFKPFVQVDSSMTRKYEGAGLGLSLAKKLLSLHRGQIWAESEGLGKGSVFRFAIPVLSEE